MTRNLLLAATLLVLTVWTSASVSAAPIVMICELLEATSKTDEARVDQIVIDAAQRSLDLRVAKTMGTSIPVNWIYRDGAVNPLSQKPTDTMSFLTMENNDLLIVAIRGNSANAFSLDSEGIFVMTYTIPGLSVETFRWKCHR